MNYREQQLFISSDLIRKTAVGKEKLSVFREFIHEFNAESKTLERNFYPIHFIPLQTHFVNEIRMKLTNDEYEPVDIRDAKTVIILHFRKVKGKDSLLEYIILKNLFFFLEMCTCWGKG